jgi:lysophospholipase L1-like esterase
MTVERHEEAPHPPLAEHRAYGQMILFGDSITQQSENQERGFAFAPALRDNYIRRLDVLNRGFSGYTSQLALHVLPQFMPDPSQARVRLMTVFFGANDACIPGNAQHVPLDEYLANLKATLHHPAVLAHQAKVLLVTPAPVDEHQLEPNDLAIGYSSVQRTAANTKRYADACRDLGKQLDVPVVDLWTIFMDAAGWKGRGPLPGAKHTKPNQVLGSLLVDGE